MSTPACPGASPKTAKTDCRHAWTGLQGSPHTDASEKSNADGSTPDIYAEISQRKGQSVHADGATTVAWIECKALPNHVWVWVYIIPSLKRLVIL